MENKNVGWLILGISVIVVLIIILFNGALTQIVNDTCGMAGHENCEMQETIDRQTYLSYSIVGILIILGIFLIFSKPKEKLVIRKIKETKKERKIDLSNFKSEEKKVFRLIKENGAIFQADLIEKTGFGKAKMSRIIDRLEGNGLVERKRRGMTNIVVLKED